LVGRQEGHPVCKKQWGDGGGKHWLVRMEWRPAGWSVSASVNLPLHQKVQKFSSGTGAPGWSRKKGRKMVVVVCVSRWLMRVVEIWLTNSSKSYKDVHWSLFVTRTVWNKNTVSTRRELDTECTPGTRGV